MSSAGNLREGHDAVATDGLLERVFLTGRSYKTWQDRPVDPAILQGLYDLMKYGPICTNCCPLRVKFVVSPEAKDVLHEAMAEVNKLKVATAPVSAILGMDMAYPDTLPVLFPNAPKVPDMYRSNAALLEETGFRNSSMQAGYFILAARAYGLDCGPMSAFDKAKVDAAFWAGTAVETNLICNLGYGKPEDVPPRDPRLAFDEACEIL